MKHILQHTYISQCMCVFEFQIVGYQLETNKRLRHTMNPSSETNDGFNVSAFVSRELFNAAYKQQGRPVMADNYLVTEKRTNRLTFPFF